MSMGNTPNAERYVLEADAMRRRQLRSALLHGSSRTWREHRRVWPAVSVGIVVAAVIVAGLAVQDALRQEEQKQNEQKQQQREQVQQQEQQRKQQGREQKQRRQQREEERRREQQQKQQQKQQQEQAQSPQPSPAALSGTTSDGGYPGALANVTRGGCILPAMAECRGSAMTSGT